MRSPMRTFPWLCCALLLTGLPARAQLSYKTVDRNVIEQRLDHLPKSDAEREAVLKEMFGEVGCGTKLSEEPVPRLREPNLICVLPGKTDAVIIVSAHFDHIAAGDGAADNWTGASLLPSLYESLSGTSRRYTFTFIGFGGEEKGLVGSKYYVSALSAEEKAKVRAIVNIDTLGLSPTKVWRTYSDPELVNLLIRTSDVMELPLAAVNVEGVGNDDADPFRRAKIPSITIHSVTQETLAILHTHDDTLRAVNLSYYFETYRLVTRYLTFLDMFLPERQVAPPRSK
ncbi:MAG: Zn-dependent exopeptidase M28 [Acidobacteriia bacterium]|nr:Zn-dependent exopeptidase M28 [Terriglobia bacterium]